MIRQTQPSREHTIHQLLRTLHILPHRHGLRTCIVYDIQSRNARPVISQQTFEAGEGDRGKVSKVAVCGRGVFLKTHGDEAVEVEKDGFDGPCVAVFG